MLRIIAEKFEIVNSKIKFLRFTFTLVTSVIRQLTDRLLAPAGETIIYIHEGAMEGKLNLKDAEVKAGYEKYKKDHNLKSFFEVSERLSYMRFEKLDEFFREYGKEKSKLNEYISKDKQDQLTIDEITYLEGLEKEKLESYKELSVEEIRNRIEEEKRNNANFEEKHPDWVEVSDIRNKILAKRNHVLKIENVTTGSGGRRGFTGCHSKIALEEYVAENPGSSFELRNKDLNEESGVYEAEPVIKTNTGEELVKLNNQGKSTFFPDIWNEAKILDEVEYAIKNNHGKVPSKPNGNEYFGFSSDGKVEIHFYLNSDGSIGSYFPVKN